MRIHRAALAQVLCALSVIPAARAASAEVRVINNDAHFPEGPVWYQGKLYYVEYDRNTVMVWDGKTNKVFSAQKGCGQSAVAPTVRGDFLTTCYDNGTIGRISADGKDLPPYTHDRVGTPFQGPNDLAPDPHGGMYFTASGHTGPIIDGKVFYIARDETITEVADDLHYANGLVVSRDGKTLYVAETEEHRLLQFDIGADGRLSGRRVFVNLDAMVDHVAPIWPDGIKISSHGEIYVGESPRDLHVALLGRIFVLDQHGRLMRQLQLPSPKVPNLAFSPDERTVYVTALDQIDRSPYEGKVYAIANE